jgi:hypothetical protein
MTDFETFANDLIKLVCERDRLNNIVLEQNKQLTQLNNIVQNLDKQLTDTTVALNNITPEKMFDYLSDDSDKYDRFCEIFFKQLSFDEISDRFEDKIYEFAIEDGKIEDYYRETFQEDYDFCSEVVENFLNKEDAPSLARMLYTVDESEEVVVELIKKFLSDEKEKAKFFKALTSYSEASKLLIKEFCIPYIMEKYNASR